jgi:hypothetical protein
MAVRKGHTTHMQTFTLTLTLEELVILRLTLALGPFHQKTEILDGLTEKISKLVGPTLKGRSYSGKASRLRTRKSDSKSR